MAASSSARPYALARIAPGARNAVDLRNVGVGRGGGERCAGVRHHEGHARRREVVLFLTRRALGPADHPAAGVENAAIAGAVAAATMKAPIMRCRRIANEDVAISRSLVTLGCFCGYSAPRARGRARGWSSTLRMRLDQRRLSLLLLGEADALTGIVAAARDAVDRRHVRVARDRGQRRRRIRHQIRGAHRGVNVLGFACGASRDRRRGGVRRRQRRHRRRGQRPPARIRRPGSVVTLWSAVVAIIVLSLVC